MKRVLTDERGIICDVVNPGEEFEVHEDLGPWKDCITPDVEASWTLHDDGTATDEWLADARSDAGVYKRFIFARTVSYGSIGEQLDMIYKDMKNGTTEWVDKVDAIKAEIPKVERPAEVDTPEDYIPPVHL